MFKCNSVVSIAPIMVELIALDVLFVAGLILEFGSRMRMTRTKRTSGRGSQKPSGGCNQRRGEDEPTAAAIPNPDPIPSTVVHAVEVPVARVPQAKVFPSPLDVVGHGKEKSLREVVTSPSKTNPPLPMPAKRKQPQEEGQEQARRRSTNSPRRRRSGRLEKSTANDGVHIHVNVDASAQSDSSFGSPSKITVWVSPEKNKRTLRRSLDVSTMPRALEAIAKCSEADEESLSRSCSKETISHHPTVVNALVAKDPPRGDLVSGSLGAADTPASLVLNPTPSYPTTSTFCGASPYLGGSAH